jgi:hypothetical protein
MTVGSTLTPPASITSKVPEDAAKHWFAEHDPDGVFEYEVHD